MAFGFPAYHTEELDEATGGADFRRTIMRAIRSLGWSVLDESDYVITASSSVNLWSWGERIKVVFHKTGGVSITSRCALFTQCLDWGRNKANVRKLLIEATKQRLNTTQDGRRPLQ